MELLTKQTEQEFESFMASHKNGSFMQSLAWPKVKNNWSYDGVISRNPAGEIIGAVLVIMQKAPIFGSCFMYAPRGPVCACKKAQRIFV